MYRASFFGSFLWVTDWDCGSRPDAGNDEKEAEKARKREELAARRAKLIKKKTERDEARRQADDEAWPED